MKHTKLYETKKKEKTMTNLDQLNQIHLVEWDEAHLVDEQGDLRVELNQVEDLKIYFPNLEELAMVEDLNSISGIYLAEEQDPNNNNDNNNNNNNNNNNDNNQDKKNQKKKSQTLMSQKQSKYHFLIFSMIRVFQ